MMLQWAIARWSCGSHSTAQRSRCSGYVSSRNDLLHSDHTVKHHLCKLHTTRANFANTQQIRAPFQKKKNYSLACVCVWTTTASTGTRVCDQTCCKNPSQPLTPTRYLQTTEGPQGPFFTPMRNNKSSSRLQQLTVPHPLPPQTSGTGEKHPSPPASEKQSWQLRGRCHLLSPAVHGVSRPQRHASEPRTTNRSPELHTHSPRYHDGPTKLRIKTSVTHQRLSRDTPGRAYRSDHLSNPFTASTSAREGNHYRHHHLPTTSQHCPHPQ